MTIVMHPTLRAQVDGKYAAIQEKLRLTMSGYEVFSALIAEVGNGEAPDCLDRFCREEFGGTWDEVAQAFEAMIRKWGKEGV